MVAAVQRLQPGAGHMSVNLGGRKIGMTKEHLNAPQISTVIQKVGREGMPQ